MEKEYEIMMDLLASGYDAYEVGGCVRDSYVGKEVTDIDIVTNATPEEIAVVFKDGKYPVQEVGKAFGVMLVGGVEVATFRGDKYGGGRHGKPTVTYVNTLEEDAKRRDYTINAIYKGIDGEVYDPTGGESDITNKIVRAVGKAEDRYTEDGSRILRGIYISGKMGGEKSLLKGTNVSYLRGWDIAPNTRRAMTNLRHVLTEVPEELKGKILLKVISTGRLTHYVKELMELELMEYVIPELVHLKGLPQNPAYHKYDAWVHTLTVVAEMERRTVGYDETTRVRLMLSALFHDVSKGLPTVRVYSDPGRPQDIGHEEHGAELARKIIIRMGLGKDLAKDVSRLILLHGDLRVPMTSKKPTRTTTKILRKIVAETKNKEDLEVYVKELSQLVLSDSISFTDSLKKEVEYGVYTFLTNLPTHLTERVLYKSDLKVTGKDLVTIGYKGPEIAQGLDHLVKVMSITSTKEDQLHELKIYKKQLDKLNA